KRTMLYMAISLSFTAGGILLCYLLHNVQEETGKTLNASLWGLLAGGWHIGSLNVGPAAVAITLISEGALPFVAAHAGFFAGPRRGGANCCRHARGPVGAKAVRPSLRAARHPDRHHLDGRGGRDRAVLHARSRDAVGRHVLDQRVPHFHAHPGRDGAPLVER